MGPFEVDYKVLLLRVFSDWRVPAMAVAILVTWALLRYVGIVFRTAPRISLHPPKKMIKKAKEKKAEAEESIEIEE